MSHFDEGVKIYVVEPDNAPRFRTPHILNFLKCVRFFVTRGRWPAKDRFKGWQNDELTPRLSTFSDFPPAPGVERIVGPVDIYEDKQ